MPLRQAGDSPAMTAAVDLLESLGAHFWRPTRSQLKIGHINFYPDTGTIQPDGGKALRDRRGLADFHDFILEEVVRVDCLRMVLPGHLA
jgi:hypothetical protein